MTLQPDERFLEWAKDKPLALSCLARFTVTSISSIRELMELRRRNQGPFAFEPAVDEQLMLSFYRRKSLVKETMQVMLDADAERAYHIYRTLLNPNSGNAASQQLALGLILLSFAPTDSSRIAELLAVSQESELSDDSLEVAMLTPVMQYALRVAIPCWLVYGVLPDQLLWVVSNKDQRRAEEAIRRLVRLDHRVIHHPIIQRWVESDERLSQFRADKLRKWKQCKTVFDKPKSDSHWLKVVFGLLSRMSDLFGYRLKAPELRVLAELVDNDLPADLAEYLSDRTTDDLSREIRRKRLHFALPAEPDRSEIGSVRELFKNSA